MKNVFKIAGTAPATNSLSSALSARGAEARAVYTTTTAVSQAQPTTTVGTGGHRHSY